MRKLLLFTAIYLRQHIYCLSAQSRHTAHTLKLDAPENQPVATIEAMNWLSGDWIGEGFGGTCQEIWSTPEAYSMMGMFQMILENQVFFYEFCQISEDNGSLILKLKHFDGKLSGWEEKDETVDFALVKIEDQAVWFDGLTYQKNGDELNVWVAIEQKDGSVEEGALVFKRAGAKKN